ncbi:hypothetical protein OUZ56_033790 [Daphnia magna]|uniref:Uncharacterized protein n=1 Tax=Daphnia magna TaxID=35525 RepID=A0ABR0BB34_9CRUS|nr:hypothetical protein OUZ56_021686 [Daphnia magna]KAK4045800.1 hypothetical protein OUZ56_033790 [Daphnia magna]
MRERYSIHFLARSGKLRARSHFSELPPTLNEIARLLVIQETGSAVAAQAGLDYRDTQKYRGSITVSQYYRYQDRDTAVKKVPLPVSQANLKRKLTGVTESDSHIEVSTHKSHNVLMNDANQDSLPDKVTNIFNPYLENLTWLYFQFHVPQLNFRNHPLNQVCMVAQRMPYKLQMGTFQVYQVVSH